MAKKIEFEVDIQTKKAESAIDNLTGGAITKFRGLTKGIGGAVKGFKTLRGAIISTGIGALVVALGTLVTYFTNTQRGADLVSKAMDGIGAAFAVITDRISLIGESLIKFFQGDFRGAIDGVKDAFTGVTDEIIRETEAAYQLRDALNNLKDEEIGLIAVNAERRKGIAEARLIAEDETLAVQERIDALDKAAELENQILEDQLRIARERARISQEQLDLGESSRQEIEENARLQAAVSELETQSLRQQRTIATRRNALIRQAVAERKVEALETPKILKVQLDTENKIVADAGEERLKILAKQNKQEVKEAELTQEAKLGIISGALGGVARLVGEGSGFGKAIAVTQAIIDTYAGASKALAQGGIFGPIAAAGIIAAGLANVKTITSTQLPSQPSFAGGGRPRTAAVSATPPQINSVGTSGISQIAQTIQGQANKPVRAYVVSGDVTTAQALDRNIVKEAGI
jgi:hypothetical protein